MGTRPHPFGLAPQQQVGKWQVCEWFDGTALVHLAEINHQPKRKPTETARE